MPSFGLLLGLAAAWLLFALLPLAPPQKYHGRFLHITDLHPDPFYKPGSLHDEMCHSGSGSAGVYGDAILGCDAPMALVEDTLLWISEKFADKIDFVVWTGDNVRHDNDRRHPRTETDIFRLNEAIAHLMKTHFGDLPVPSLGNNDVYPHNLFAPGPTLQTREFFKIWRPFVPQAQMNVFNRGVYFFKEVVPGQLAVLSINTLYLFDSNPLVDSCDRKKDPGYLLFKWLGNVLEELRKRDMKVWLTGHVPPTPKNYDMSCLRKYIAWSHEYRDIIVGGLYGHMNIDHFVPLDAKLADTDSVEADTDTLAQLYSVFNPEFSPIHTEGGVPNGKVEYMNTLRLEMYGKIKSKAKAGEHGERYNIVHVSPSVVPTFNPGFRVWEYNITGLKKRASKDWTAFFAEVDKIWDPEYTGSDDTVPPRMPKKRPLGPAYVEQLFTPVRYLQYYLDLEAVNKGGEFAYKVEYTTDGAYGMRLLVVAEWLKLGRRLGAAVRLEQWGKLWGTFLRFTFVSLDYEHKGYG